MHWMGCTHGAESGQKGCQTDWNKFISPIANQRGGGRDDFSLKRDYSTMVFSVLIFIWCSHRGLTQIHLCLPHANCCVNGQGSHPLNYFFLKKHFLLLEKEKQPIFQNVSQILKKHFRHEHPCRSCLIWVVGSCSQEFLCPWYKKKQTNHSSY